MAHTVDFEDTLQEILKRGTETASHDWLEGIKEEYDIAAEYLTRLMQEIDLPAERLFIVPGNHDVNRKLYRPSDFPSYQSMRDLNKELENTDFRSDLWLFVD